MKKLLGLAAAVFLIVMINGSLAARERATVAIIPFNVYSAENIEYIRQGIQGILTSRLTASPKIELINRETVAAALKAPGQAEITQTAALALGNSLRADYVVWGSVTKIGSSISLDGRLAEVSTGKSPVFLSSQMSNLDEVIPRTSEFAQRIIQQVIGEAVAEAPQRPQPSAAPLPAVSPAPPRAPAPKTTGAREEEIIAALKGQTGKRTLTSVINPEFITAPGTAAAERRGFWMSPEIPAEIKGMDIGDVTGDGTNEIVMIDANSVLIYRKKGSEFQQIHHVRGKSHLNYISVDVADINQNGIKEIIVTSMNHDILNSFVLEYRNGAFIEIAGNIRYFLRVIEPSRDRPILLGQTIGMDSPFKSQIYEMIWERGAYRSGRKMKIPEGLSIYGLTIDSLGSGGDKIISLSDLDYLYLFQPTDKPLSRIAVLGGSKEMIYKSEEPYGGSNNLIYIASKATREREVAVNTYANHRILTYDLDGDGRREIIIPKNISPAGRYFSNIRVFTASEIHALTWVGLGLSEVWRTKKITGYVTDHQIKDLDNNGKDKIVLAIVRGLGTGYRGTSILVSYDLKGN